MTLESIAPVSDNLIVKLPALAALAYRPYPPVTAIGARLLHHSSGHDPAEAADVPPATPTPQPAKPSPQPNVQDKAIAEILATVRATDSRSDALQDAPAHDTAAALARERAALTQPVTDLHPISRLPVSSKVMLLRQKI